LAYLALDFEADLQKAATTTDVNAIYTLPNRQEIVIANDRFRCSEMLFKPSLNGLFFDRIDCTLFDSIRKCDVDVKKDVSATIVLSGGTTMLPGCLNVLRKKSCFLQLQQ
jgi:actin